MSKLYLVEVRKQIYFARNERSLFLFQCEIGLVERRKQCGKGENAAFCSFPDIFFKVLSFKVMKTWDRLVEGRNIIVLVSET